jgi:hypothetical protein
MWKRFHCYLSGRHDFGVWCESGEIFLRCIHCGNRSSGWALEGKPSTTAPHVTAAAEGTPSMSSHALSFDRVETRQSG